MSRRSGTCRLALWLAAWLLWQPAPQAQTWPSALEPASSGGIQALAPLLARLEGNRRLLVIGAHPDDEDTSLLSLVARGMGGEAAYLALSRGEGGQNLVGSELGVELGLLRSQELVSARSVDGARQYFTRAYDFGYTRSLEETFAFWPRQELLLDVVRVVRRFRPQVVVSVFPPTTRAGHGQHQAAGVMAEEAFEAAGDPARFPELQAEGLEPWQPSLLYRSAWFNPEQATLVLPTGGVETITGRSFFQIAMASRSMHRSQDMGTLQDLGPRQARVEWLAAEPTSDPEAAGPKTLFGGIDTRLEGLARLAPPAAGPARERLRLELQTAAGEIVAARRELSVTDLEAILEPLLRALEGLRRAHAIALELRPTSITLVELLEEKISLAEQAAAVAAGIAVDATVAVPDVVLGSRVSVTARLYNAGNRLLAVRPSVSSPAGWLAEEPSDPAREVSAGELADWSFEVDIPRSASPTVPYFVEPYLSGGDGTAATESGLGGFGRRPPALYDWSMAPPATRGHPFAAPPLGIRFSVRLDGVEIGVEREVVHRDRDQVLGEVRRPLRAVPAIEVRMQRELVVWPVDDRATRVLEAVLESHVEETLDARVVVTVPAGWPQPAPVPVTLGSQARAVVELPVDLPAAIETGRYELGITVQVGEQVFGHAFPLVDYPHIRSVPSLRRARVELHAGDLRLPALDAVGYVRGASDRVPEFLSEIGLPIELLSAEFLRDATDAQLDRFDVIVIGSRAYESDAGLVEANERLLDYGRRGGVLVVQYQQYQFARGAMAPYELNIERPHGRVTDETAPVEMLVPEHDLFKTPNHIGPSDWQGWIQERGLYFPSTWAPEFEPLLAMADPGRSAERGALLIAPLGDGLYVYTGLAFFRQLPAGVTGAYRLFLNLLALDPTSAN